MECAFCRCLAKKFETELPSEQTDDVPRTMASLKFKLGTDPKVDILFVMRNIVFVPNGALFPDIGCRSLSWLLCDVAGIWKMEREKETHSVGPPSCFVVILSHWPSSLLYWLAGSERERESTVNGVCQTRIRFGLEPQPENCPKSSNIRVQSKVEWGEWKFYFIFGFVILSCCHEVWWPMERQLNDPSTVPEIINISRFSPLPFFFFIHHQTTTTTTKPTNPINPTQPNQQTNPYNERQQRPNLPCRDHHRREPPGRPWPQPHGHPPERGHCRGHCCHL